MPPTPAPPALPRRRPSPRGAALRRRLDVLLQDAALVAAALDRAEIDAELARELAHAGAGVGEREARLRRRRGPGAGAAACGEQRLARQARLPVRQRLARGRRRRLRRCR